MYSALIGAGISVLSDVFRSQTASSTSAAFPDPAEPKTTAGSQADPSSGGQAATNPLSHKLDKLLLDLQSANSADPSQAASSETAASSVAAYARTASVGLSRTA